MAKWAACWPGFGGLGFKKLGDLPKWLVFSFSSKVLSVALGNIDSSSRIDKIPMGYHKTRSVRKLFAFLGFRL